MDVVLLKIVEFVPDLKQHLSARFNLRLGMKPRKLLFLKIDFLAS